MSSRSRFTSRPKADRLDGCKSVVVFMLCTRVVRLCSLSCCVSRPHKYTSPFCPSALRSLPSNHSCRLPARRPSGRPSPPCYPHVVPSGSAAALRAIYTTGPSLTAVVLPSPGTFASHLRAHGAGDARSRHTCRFAPYAPCHALWSPPPSGIASRCPWRFAPGGRFAPFEGPAVLVGRPA